MVDRGTDGIVNAGDTVTFSFEIKNTGHTCLAVANIVDDNAGKVECPYVTDMAGEELWPDTFRTFGMCSVHVQKQLRIYFCFTLQ